MERWLALWLRRFSACFARFLAEGVLATVKLLEKTGGLQTNKAANHADMPGHCQACCSVHMLVWPLAARYTRRLCAVFGLPDRTRLSN
jgi:hypothetical protein